MNVRYFSQAEDKLHTGAMPHLQPIYAVLDLLICRA